MTDVERRDALRRQLQAINPLREPGRHFELFVEFVALEAKVGRAGELGGPKGAASNDEREEASAPGSPDRDEPQSSAPPAGP